jgi:endonuclease/exonuclease/phosphatase family metal-dependent hydrolase
MSKKMLLLIVLQTLIFTGFAQVKVPVSVASYNIRYDNPHDGDNGWEFRKEHVKELIQFHDFDIFGIQEGMYNQVTDIAALEQYAWYGKGRDDGDTKGEHCAIFFKKDRFDLLNSGSFWLSETPDIPTIGWDSRVNKRVCSWGRLRDRINKNEFYFFSVHFDNLGAQARRESAKLMVAKIPEIAGDMPVIVVGDFNSTPETEQIATLETLLRDSYKVSKIKPYGPDRTTGGFQYDPVREKRTDSIYAARAQERQEANPAQRRGGSRRIDYIFVSDKIEVLKHGVIMDFYGSYRFPSDHFPIVSTILIN